jgi:glycosyltransferase involved in cell wall biosynthesis
VNEQAEVTVDGLRVCRAIFSYPTSAVPGAGLPAYYLSDQLPCRTLHLARRLPGEPRSIGRHVDLRLIRCPNPALSGSRGFWSRAWRFVLKAVGIAMFTLRAIPPLVRFRPHILCLHTHLPAPLAIAGRMMGARVAITVHGTDLLAVRRSRLLRWIYRNMADEIWYVSEAMKDDLRQLCGDRPLRHVPSGVDLALFRSTAAVRHPQILAVGRLVWQKAYPDLIRAFFKIHGDFPDHRLIIIGEGELRPELERLVRTAGLGDRIVLAGGRTQEQIVAAMNESQLFVLSSVSEGFPKVLLEALACGLPAVVTDTGSCGVIVRRHGVGIVATPGDIDALADALRRMLTDTRLRESAAANAPDAVIRDGWSAVATIVDGYYKQLVETGLTRTGWSRA